LFSLLTNQFLIGFAALRCFAAIPVCERETAEGSSVDGGVPATDSRFASLTEG
jgi:hypothetical protein